MKSSQTTRILTKLPDFTRISTKHLENYQNLNKTPRKLPESQQTTSESSQTTRISTKLPESQQNYQILNKTPRKVLKLPESHQNYQNLIKTPVKYDEKFSNYQNINRSGVMGDTPPTNHGVMGDTPPTNQGVMGDTPPTNQGVIGTPHKPPRNHPRAHAFDPSPPQSGGHGEHSPNLIYQSTAHC